MKCATCNKQTVKDIDVNTVKSDFKMLYSNNACLPEMNNQIVLLIKEGLGIRCISRILAMSPTTLLKRIISIFEQIQKLPILLGRNYEVDEMMSLVQNKN